MLRLELPRLHATSLDALGASDAAASAGLVHAAGTPNGAEVEVCVSRGVYAAARLRGKQREESGRGKQVSPNPSPSPSPSPSPNPSP